MILQLGLDALARSGIYALVALGFTLIYMVNKFFHFTHAAIYLIGGYVTFALRRECGLPIPLCIGSAGLVAGAFGWAVNEILFRPARVRGIGPLGLFLLSVGAYAIVESLWSIIYGEGRQMVLRFDEVPVFRVASGSLSGPQAAKLGMALVVFACVWCWMKWSPGGRGIRAVADSADLAATIGIDASRVQAMTFIVGSVVAGLAGGAASLDSGVTTRAGMDAVLVGVTVSLFAGWKSLSRIVLGSLLVGVLQATGGWLFGGQWESAVTLLFLTVYLAGQGLRRTRQEPGRALDAPG